MLKETPLPPARSAYRAPGLPVIARPVLRGHRALSPRWWQSGQSVAGPPPSRAHGPEQEGAHASTRCL